MGGKYSFYAGSTILSSFEVMKKAGEELLDFKILETNHDGCFFALNRSDTNELYYGG